MRFCSVSEMFEEMEKNEEATFLKQDNNLRNENFTCYYLVL